MSSLSIEELTELAKTKFKEALSSAVQQSLKPPPNLSLSEWASEYFRLSPEASAEPGKFDWARAPYQKEMLDACSDPNYEKVVFATSAQIGKTTALLALLLYYIQKDPAPILLVQPTKELAGSFSKDRLAPALRDSRGFKGVVSDVKSRDSANTILAKSFPGGQITLVGANAPSSLASRPIRVCLLDEIDRYPLSAGTEGDPVSLAVKRTTAFFNRKIIMVSTPTQELTSKVWPQYLNSDQRKYYIQCQHCEDRFIPTWEFVKWEKREDGKHLPSTARLYCPSCGTGHTDPERQAAVRHGEWRKHNHDSKVAGFHLSALISPFTTLEGMVEEWLESQHDVTKLKTFINTVLGEVWKDKSENLDGLDLISRVEKYELDKLPNEISLITAGIDTQDDRLECSLYGWGIDNEVWHLSHKVFHGSPAAKGVFEELEEYLKQRFTRADGYKLPIAAACIDSGGHFTQQVYEWSRKHRTKRWFAIKGRQGHLPVWPSRATYTKQDGRLYIVGVDSARETVYGWLKNPNPGPGYVHFSDRCDADFFDQLTSAKKVLTTKNGHNFYTWMKDPNRRAETLDCFEYALAARESLSVNLKNLRHKQKSRVQEREEALRVQANEEESIAIEAITAPTSPSLPPPKVAAPEPPSGPPSAPTPAPAAPRPAQQRRPVSGLQAALSRARQRVW